MFKNRKVVLSSIAIIFTLIVSAIFVNFTLANSGTPVDKSEADTSGNSSLVGYTNIDLAVINSNDANLKKTGKDKFRVVQILPDGLASYATADTEMTNIVTATGYSGDIKNEAQYKQTSDLWKYVYDGEFFRYAVFNGYKTITSADMAKGAVQLTTKTVSELNGMDTEAQEVLANADFIYIVATKADDYAAGATDLSEELYNWLDVYATADSHPLVIDRYALCTAEPETITGNNDQYRMGALAYKVITKTLKARYDNVLVVEPGFFNVLYKEASGNQTEPMKNTTKTISDFILTAERSATEGGRDYINRNTYYKWYTSDTLNTFLNNKSSQKDSAYAKVSSSVQGLTAKKRAWDFDNANVLIITDGTSNSMFQELAASNDAPKFSADAYEYNSKTQTWEAVEKAENSVFTSAAYVGNYRYVPSGANIYVLQSKDILKGVNASSDADGVSFATSDIANTYFKDIKVKEVSGTIQSKADLTGTMVYLVVTPDDGVSRLAGSDENTVLSVELTTGVDGNGSLDEETGIYTYKYSFPKVNDGYTYSVIVEPVVSYTPSEDEDTGDSTESTEDSTESTEDGTESSEDSTESSEDSTETSEDSTETTEDTTETGTGNADAITEDYLVGSNGNNFIISVKGESKDAAYDYTNDADEYKEFEDKCNTTTTYANEIYDTDLMFDTAEQVFDYVKKLYDEYKQDVILPKIAQDATNAIDFTDYDFIFIESGDYNRNTEEYSDEIGDNAYQKLCSAVEQGVYVIASSEAGDGIGSGNNDDTKIPEDDKIIISSPSAKVIADIINAGVYRNGSDNKFRVLEIQPDYPIDEELARSSSNANGAGAWQGGTNTRGQTITGDYYTVPSDVIAGSAKEELAPDTEYYDFDLTKAKIAYAIEGVSYGDIALTQVSTEALIGMTEDISATYDLIYIGGDISALDRDLKNIYNSSIFSYVGPSAEQLASAIPTFIMYYHTGTLKELGAPSSYKMDRSTTGSEMMVTPVIGSTKYKTTYVVENGNDLTKTKYDELISYINLGRPVMVGEELTSVYEMINGTDTDGNTLTDVQKSQGYWYNNGKLERKNYYLDPSSRMYDLVQVLYNRKSKSNNVLWGFDATDTVKVDNTAKTYGDTLYTAKGDTIYLDTAAQQESWYNDATATDVVKEYATVFSMENNTAINNLIKQSSQRARLTVITSPVEYQQGIESTYLKTTNLSYSFVVNGTESNYQYSICIDVNKNTQFDDEGDSTTSGSLAAGEDKTVNVALDPEFFGSAYWRIQITDANKNVVAEKTGICKIVNNTDGMSEINVLQVQTMSEGDDATSWTATDTLYFDIQSQTAHKILKYNTYANQTALDTISAQQYECLGRHENRFGIVEYDTDLYYGSQKGNDDYLSNLADALAEDYDISLDMVVASATQASFKTGENVEDTYECLDTWVEEAETLKGGGKVDGHTQAEYKTLVSQKLTDYSAKAADAVTPKENLDDYLRGAIQALNGTYTGSTNYGTRGQYNSFLGGFKTSVSNAEIIELLEYTIDTGEYYMIFWPVYSTNTDIKFSNGQISSTMFGSEFVDLFIKYRDAKNAELEAKDVYQQYLRRSYGADFMKKMYSILVLGPSDSFGGFKVDFKEKTCQYILDYVSSGGDLFFFHDTMTPYADAGAVNLTKSLLDVVGMNRFHVDLTNNANSYTVSNDGYITGFTQEGMVQGTLTEDGYIYMPETYNVTHDWQGPKDGWEKDKEYFNASANYSQMFYRKWATAGTSGYIWQEGGKPSYNQENVSLTYKSPDADLYYLTPYVNNTVAGNSLVNSINANMVQIADGSYYNKVGNIGMYVSALSITSLYYDKNGGGGATFTLPYVYAQSDFQNATSWSASSTADQSANSQTVKAKRLNEGLLTLYPYKIGESLNISGTHQQVYALDLESDKVTVWYTLAGSNNSSDAKKRSSLYAADPYDAMENYFIYTTSYGDGAITYCGAGHGSVTGPTTRNNDERKLFINVIVNSAQAVKAKPTLTIHDPDKNFDSEMAKDEEILESTGKTVYVTEVEDKTTSPEFDIKITIPQDVTIDAINVYYDLNYDESDFGLNRPSYTNGTDKMIWNSPYSEAEEKGFVENSASSKKIQIKDKYTDSNNLKPAEEYYSPYGGNYTYIVVEVYYNGKTKPVYTMIKVKASDPLFNLTQNESTIDVAAVDSIDAKKFVMA